MTQNQHPSLPFILWGKRISALSLCFLLLLAHIALIDWLFGNPFPQWLAITCGLSFVPLFFGMILWGASWLWQKAGPTKTPCKHSCKNHL